MFLWKRIPPVPAVRVFDARRQVNTVINGSDMSRDSS